MTVLCSFQPGANLTPQQKATMMASLILADYMWFEKDNGMCSMEGRALTITFCDIYCCGHTTPIKVRFENN
jgi:hypothetical protein